MLKNYFKIAIAVLRRRKFFTFISLFGISFTLTILMVVTAFINRIINDTYPDRKRDRSLYIGNMSERGPQSYNGSLLSFYFITNYVMKMKTPVKVAISSSYQGTNTYVNNKKIAINFKYTNAAYWEVLEYEFLEGKAFTASQIANGEKVTVISEDTRRAYFGDVQTVVGKYIEADNEQYRISGVVKNLPVTNYMMYADMYLPYTLSRTDYTNVGYRGEFYGILLAGSIKDVPKMQKEYADIISRLPPSDKEFNSIYSVANPFLKAYVDTGDSTRSGVAYAVSAIIVFVLLCTLLPTLNLVNINITRIMERSSEIGVRKAFGASSKTLVYQFLVENIILTLLGGLLAVVLSLIVLAVVNHANLIANLNLELDFTVLFIGLVTCLFFGLLSGVYPAWRMSRLNIVKALKV